MQASCEAVFHQGDGVVASEVRMAWVVIVHLMGFFVHALGLTSPAKIQGNVVAELGMELAVHTELDDVSEVVGPLVG